MSRTHRVLDGEERYSLLCGDSSFVLDLLPDACVDSMVTDPPAGISFMGRDWDQSHGGRDGWVKAFAAIFSECLRVLKPGAHALVWALPRTSHWTATALEDAGFEVRDVQHHHFGTGFPKSLDVSKAIDKAAGVERKKIGRGKGRTGQAAQPHGGSVHSDDNYQWPGEFDITAPGTDAAKQWEGWGTALKPATEHWILCRKPLDGTVAANVLTYGTGGLNIDGCRVSARSSASGAMPSSESDTRTDSVREGAGDLPGEEGKTIPSGTKTSRATSDSNSGMTRSDATSWSSSIAKSGENDTDPCPEDSSFTTKTKSRTTIDCETSNSKSARRTRTDMREAGDTPKARRKRTMRGLTDENPKSKPDTHGKSESAAGVGRWPPNLLLSHAAACVPVGTCKVKSGTAMQQNRDGGVHNQVYGEYRKPPGEDKTYVDADGMEEVEAWECSPGCPVAEMDVQSGKLRARGNVNPQQQGSSEGQTVYGQYGRRRVTPDAGDIGGASRFFPRFRYQAKAPARERSAGLPEGEKNKHPTVKPVELMRWLCRLVTPPGGVVLDPFMGSGSTGVACVCEGFRFVGIEREKEYHGVAVVRVSAAKEV